MSGDFYSGARSIPRLKILERAARAATGLDQQGLGPGGAVAVIMRNDFPFIEASLAARMLTAYPVPINWHYQAEEVRYILEDSAAKAIVIHADLLPQCSAGFPEGLPVFVVPTPAEIQTGYGLSDDDCAVPRGATDWGAWLEGFEPWQSERPPAFSMIYTSGTTGNPKGVRREPSTPDMEQRMQARLARVFGLRAGMRAIIPAPMYHSAPNAFALFSTMLDSSLVLQPRFDAEEFLRLVEKHRITNVQMVPTMFVRLLKLPQAVRERYDLSSLENVVHAAAPCPVDVKQAMIEWWGPVINEYYGSTESGAVSYVTSPEWLAFPGTVGQAVDEATLRILDEDGGELPAGEIGEIYMRNEAMPGFTYHNNEQKRREIERDGLITNGDMGYVDQEGHLFLCDRRADMVISGGVNIYPAEVEGALIGHPGVLDCAVFGIPHDEYGETLAAVIQPAPDSVLSANDVQEYLSSRLAGFKVPRVIEFRSELPREDSGKIFKRKLRDPYWENAGRKI